MGNIDPRTREMMSRLALSCSALARAGQVLSMVSDAGKTDGALRQAASILGEDARASRLPQIEAVAMECQAALDAGDPAGRVTVCRQLATRLARLASNLANEVQEQTRKGGKPEVKPAATVPQAPPVPPATPVPSRVIPTPEKLPARPRVDFTSTRVAASVEERTAVTAALEAGQRFADVGNGTVIDPRMNLMWAAKVGPAGSHSSAGVYAGQCRLGGYADWRLPRPEELQHFLAGGGASILGGGSGEATALWTSETSRRWLFLRLATAVQVRAGSMKVMSARRSDVGVLVLRTATGSR